MASRSCSTCAACALFSSRKGLGEQASARLLQASEGAAVVSGVLLGSNSEFRVQGFGSGVLFGVQGSGFRIWGCFVLGSQIRGLGYSVSGLGCFS